ncbi:hypothetical protein [Oceaniglobus trochenteri]|uniref:hypothetical protein n=1 Tax=Oceaniglobus trochenteri TaxID=2763260 RepID=UPI001D000163|nr:hypothetical protein [Oceaniglobus trochenteri]
MNGPVQVILTGPAKIAGRRESVGAIVTVSYDQALELGAADAVSMIDGAPVIHEGDDAFHAAVAARAEEIAKAMLPDALDTALAEITATADKAEAQAKSANDRADKLTEELKDQQRLAEDWFERAEKAEAEVARLNTELTKAKEVDADSKNTPPESEAAKTTPKKGAAPKTKS